MNNRELAKAIVKKLMHPGQAKGAACIVEAVLNEQQPSNQAPPTLPPAPWLVSLWPGDRHGWHTVHSKQGVVAHVLTERTAHTVARLPEALAELREAAADLDAAAIACVSRNSGDPFRDLATTHRALADSIERGEEPHHE
ncbi:MAG: hypothetical protein V3W41_14620 [Planctomycetota bacterium]